MPEITIYTTPTCIYCRMAKEFFRQNNISYKEIDVSMDEQKAREMIRKSGQMGVPVIEIDDKIIIGFNKPKIIQILGLK